MCESKFKLDARAGLFLLFVLNFAVFSVSSVVALGLLLLWSAIYGIYKKYYTATIKFALVYIASVLANFFILPKCPGVIAISFAVLLIYALKILPIALFGYVFAKTTTLQELTASLRKIHFPESIITGLSITLRYFPALKEDYYQTRDAMKLKNMSFIEKMSGLVITTITRASMNIEDLSLAATVRGIDNPIKKSSMTTVHIKKGDIFVCLVSVLYYFLICKEF
ncbi:MAG: energy-coupling factor transporter transmembrane protein EcfT [Eubacteriaceae bacterium]|jgi:energy-coupling factor transport system permease protein|nr:energy-coupling factor transporter transmembrane protein EcfT [Eubacteriaceae bacterium]